VETGDAPRAKIDDLGVSNDTLYKVGTVKTVPAQKALGCFKFFPGCGPSKDNPKTIENGRNQKEDEGDGEVGKHRV